MYTLRYICAILCLCKQGQEFKQFSLLKWLMKLQTWVTPAMMQNDSIASAIFLLHDLAGFTVKTHLRGPWMAHVNKPVHNLYVCTHAHPNDNTFNSTVSLTQQTRLSLMTKANKSTDIQNV